MKTGVYICSSVYEMSFKIMYITWQDMHDKHEVSLVSISTPQY